MSDEPTLHSLHLLLVAIKKDTEHFNAWKASHEIDDNSEHKALHKRITDNEKKMHNIAIVSVVFGFVIGAALKLKSYVLGG